jgi:putative ABC transport system permease protein
VLGNYLSIALRHFVTQRLYSAINVLGLAIGLACFIVIALFVRHELGYDRHFANAERIYRVSRDFRETVLAANAAPVAALLKEDFPQIEQAARMSLNGAVLGLRDGSVVEERGLRYADNELFEIFDFEWLRGDAATALVEPATVVLTASAARRYFADQDPLGQTLLLEDRLPIEVTGVIADLGDDTHLDFSMLVSMPTLATIRGPRILESWGFNQYYTYVLLRPGADIEAVQRQSGDFFERHLEQGSSEYTGFSTTPLTDIHLRANRSLEIRPPGSLTMVYTFSAIALFVLAIACVNFINLATARSAQRAKEIGVRKSIGASRRQLVVQFLCESVLLSVIAVVLAVAAVDLALPRFNAFLGLSLTFDYLGEPAVLTVLAALALVTGFAAGAYPALYLSAFDPARVLKGDATRGTAAAGFRKALVIFQFSISIALLIATSVVYLQLQFSRNIDLGYEKDQIVVVNGSFSAGLGDQWETLKREWLAHPDVTHVTASILAPTTDNTNGISIRAEGGPSEGDDAEGAGLPFMWIDYGFFETYDIAVVAGRTFSEDFASDRMAAQPRDGSSGAYILNERGARHFGWTPEEAIGKWLELVPARNRGPVIGVVEDVHYESVRTEITPMIYMVPPEGTALGYQPLLVASLRITGRNLQGTLEHIDTKWAELVPNQPIVRRFLDQDFNQLYQSEERQGKMVTTFTALAIFIACLGLFGLASFATERRTKEIGVRKALGGGVLDIVRLFTAEFTKLVLVASAIAWPVSYWLMEMWLESFAYRVDLSPFVFLGATAAALTVAWLTVGGVAARAASAKPIRALRYE